jgi:hypothetical protein
MKKFVLLYFILLYGFSASAQVMIRGLVEDSVSHEPLEMATVTLLRSGKPLSFARTDAKGRFVLKANGLQKTDRLLATYLGYAKVVANIPSDRQITLRMHPESFNLKEVTIRAGRIYGRQDTISYDLSRFADSRDNNLKDVLKKLPGVDVDKDGAVSYNGKAITRFTVEGLDLTGGRYNLINENLKAKDVQKAEIIEHDQPIRALQKKLTTDNVAMNVKLKPEARDKWIPTLTPVLKVGNHIADSRIGGTANALQIGRRQQSLYIGEIDQTGKDLLQSDKQLAASGISSFPTDAGIPAWYDAPALSAPLDAERLRFNTSQSINMNRTFKTKKDRDIRINAGYTHSTIRQTTSNQSIYYLDNSPVETNEQKQLRLLQDHLYLGLNSEINTDKNYGAESFCIDASQADGFYNLSDADGKQLPQRIKIPTISATNKFYRLRNYADHTLSVRSLFSFAHSPSSLDVDSVGNQLFSTRWYADNSLCWLKKYGFFTQQYTAGIDAESISLHGNNNRWAAYLNTYWEYQRGCFTSRLSNDFRLNRFTGKRHSYFEVAPQLYLTFKAGFRHEWEIYGKYWQEAGDWSSFLLTDYRKDYRTTYLSDGVIPWTRNFNTGVIYSYKRPVNEFFWTASVYYQTSRRNIISDLQIADGQYIYHEQQKDNHFKFFQAGSTLSKGIFSLFLKTKLTFNYNRTNGEQSSLGNIMRYRNNSYTASPEISFSPSWGVLSYSGLFVWTKTDIDSSTPLETLLNWSQNISLTKTIGHVDLSLSAVHYYNELQSSPAVKMWLADASLVWHTKKMRMELKARNLLDKQHYALTSYSGISSFTNSYILRPREILLSVQWTL